MGKNRRVKLGTPNADALHQAFIGSDGNAQLSAAFTEVVRLLSESSEGRSWNHDKQLIPCGYALDNAMFSTKARDALRQLWKAIEDNIDRAYAYGKNQGQELLMGLARGDVTVNQFNDETLKDRP